MVKIALNWYRGVRSREPGGFWGVAVGFWKDFVAKNSLPAARIPTRCGFALIRQPSQANWTETELFAPGASRHSLNI